MINNLETDDVNLAAHLNDNNFENLLLTTEGLEPLSSRRENLKSTPSEKKLK